MGPLENVKTTNPATSSSHSADTHDNAIHNLHNLSTTQSPGQEHFSPVLQGFQSPPSLFATPRINFDQQAAFPRWSQQPQLPGSEIAPQALGRTSFAHNTPQIYRTSTDPTIQTQLNQIEYQTNSYDRSKYFSQYTNGDAAIPPKKRKKANEDCKRCNCKKTKCLKLYCECFSSGYYCDKTCSCQECYNTPDYEDTVQESRENIEIRNPLAFSPKLGDGTFLNASSGKYRRGCNCKKTMCQKKYCECFQSTVGCTDICRCDGCENIYGKKGEYSKTKEMLRKRSVHQISGITFDENLQKVARHDYLPQTEQQHCNLSSLTSPLQFPYLQSPASNFDYGSLNGNSPQIYQNFDNSSPLSNSRNYCQVNNVTRRLNLQNTDTSKLSVPNNGVHNSFDPNTLFNDQASPITPSNSLPFSESQNIQIPPFGESLYFGNDYDNNYVFDGYTPPEEVRTVTFDAQGQMFTSSRSLRGARNALLFPPLTPVVDRKECNISAKNDDGEDSKV